MTYGTPKDRFEYIRLAALRQKEAQRARLDNFIPPPVEKEKDRCLREVNPANNRFFDVDERLDQIFREELRRPWERTIGVYHPSSIHPGRCKRELYHDRLGTQPRPSHRSYMQSIFDEGHGSHEMIQRRLRGGHAGFQEELRVEIPDLHVAGSMDGLFSVEDWILEIKTMGESTFSSLVQPKEMHVWQVHLYMFGLDIPRTQLLYVNRNNGRRRNFKVLFSVDVWEQVVAFLQDIEGMFQRGEEPPVIQDKYTCGMCKFQYYCHAPPADGGMDG